MLHYTRIEEIKSDFRGFEHVANIRFSFKNQCDAPVDMEPLFSAVGHAGIEMDYYHEDIRIWISESDLGMTLDNFVDEDGNPIYDSNGNLQKKAPGRGCNYPMTWSSWSSSPKDARENKMCMVNFRLGNDGIDVAPEFNPFRRHTLHEGGHAMGLSHEHQRADARSCIVQTDPDRCIVTWTDGEGNKQQASRCQDCSDSLWCTTKFDPWSIMNYGSDYVTPPSSEPCVEAGNYSHGTFTDVDALTLHIMYPEDDRMAERTGSLMIPLSNPLVLRSTWELRGANMKKAVSGFRWMIDGKLVSSGTSLYQKFSTPGSYALHIEYTDFLDRTYIERATVRVYTDDDYNRLVGVLATQITLL